MLSLCKTMHTLLGFPDPDPDDRRRPPSRRHPSPRRGSVPAPDPSCGLRILAGVEDGAPRPSSPNVLESSAVAKRAPPPPPPPAPSAAPDRGSGQVAPVGIYKLDYGRGELCTESLGAESCVGAMSKEEEGVMTGRGSSWGWKQGTTPTRGRWREERKRLPPVLSWLDGGRRSRFLRAEREEGRFRLTEVQIERPPELLRASRCDGRLRLDLIVVSDDEEEVEEEMEEQQEEKIVREEEKEIVGGGSEREVRMAPATRCQDAVSGDGIAMWLDHRRFVTTA